MFYTPANLTKSSESPVFGPIPKHSSDFLQFVSYSRVCIYVNTAFFAIDPNTQQHNRALHSLTSETAGLFPLLTNAWRPALGTVLVLGLASCSLAPVKDFGESSKVGVAAAEKAYQTFDEEYIEARTISAGLRGELRPNHFNSLVSEKDSKLRAELLSSLGKYAESLETLANWDIRGNIAKSTATLGDSLEGLSASYNALSARTFPLSSSEINLLETLFRTAATKYLEAERKQAIKEIVTKTNPAIQQVADILPYELRLMGKNLHSHMTTTRDSLILSFNSSPSRDISKVLELSNYLREYSRQVDQVRPAFDETAEVIVKIGAAHQALADAVAENKFSSKQLQQELQDLNEAVSAVKKTYSATKK
jgi:methyl-accepting chemotaxis protein